MPFFFFSKEKTFPYFVDTEQKRCLSKLLGKFKTTLHNYSIVQLKDKSEEKKLPYNSLYKLPSCTSCILIAIPVCHKHSHLVTLFIKQSMHHLRVHYTSSDKL